MAHTGIVIGKESWAVLREEPFYSARFIDQEGTEEIAAVVRVEVLDWFLEVQPPLTLNLTTWCSPRGTWVVAIAYQLHPAFGGAKGGIFYLNPCQTADAEILRKLLQQEGLPVILLSEDCREHYTVEVAQDPQELERWRQLVTDMKCTLAGVQLVDGYDPDFEAALQEFQQEQC
ncbi:MAG TPA: hypothetical protein VGX03_02960 [Candidatus Binatia bacterium]|jgi:hypothetical protein|nr:hypothetical protein [Candidatus Binatia bacterium]